MPGEEPPAVGAGDRIVHVEQRRYLLRMTLAVVDGHGAVGALGHDLQGLAFAGPTRTRARDDSRDR